MHVELVETTTPDKLQLFGALSLSQSEGQGTRLAICLHGVASNFYSSGMMAQLACGLNQQGMDVLRVNTRGHDACAHIRSAEGGLRLGAAFEIVDDCRHDIAGWLRFAQERGYREVILLGHSLGALKVIYHQAHEGGLEVGGVVALSPPRLSHQAFRAADSSGGSYLADLQRAARQVEAGEPDDLIPVRFPLPLLITARGYLDKYGPGERYNLLEFIGRVKVPLLLTYGGLELAQGSVAFAGVPEAIAAAVSGEDDWRGRVEVIERADHLYRGKVEDLLVRIGQWLSELDAP